MSGKQRMLDAYRGVRSGHVPVAPEFWCYYPARVLGVDMIEFEREVPFHLALKATFERFACDGWGVCSPHVPNEHVTSETREEWVGDDTLLVRTVTRTPLGELASATRHDRHEPGWVVERPVKDVERDLAAWELAALGGEAAGADVAALEKAREEVGETYLLEASLGVPFFDFYAGAREGGFEAGIYDFMDPGLEGRLEGLQKRYIAYMVELTRAVCAKSPVESLFIGCAWSCNSLIGPAMWRRWDAPVIRAVCEEAHRHGRLLHVHFHGRSTETAADFAEMGVDCVCPFERPPGGDVGGLDGLREVARLLDGRVTFNGNVHTVETLIRGGPEDVRREVREVLEAFGGSPRLVVGTGDQVGRETPEENLFAMVEEARSAGCGA